MTEEKKYEEVNPNVWKPEENGSYVEGIFVDMQEMVGPNESNIYYVEDKDNGIRTIWGSTILDDRMRLVNIGEEIKITYKGLADKKPGKNAAKIFKVERVIKKQE